MEIGDLSTEPGEIARGYLPVTELPTAQPEHLPVVVVDGAHEGPTLWVTAGIHPDETTGIATAHVFLDWLAPDGLAGTVVSVPVMNPAGLRVNRRASYYHDEDPNRQFGREARGDGARPRVQARINDRVYDHVRASADAIVSLHTSWAASHPYVLHPRVPYGRSRSRSAAEMLCGEIEALADAFGLPVVTAFDASAASQRSMEHTLSSLAVGRDGIPTIIPELGGRYRVDPAIRDAGVAGLTHVLVTLDMVSEPLPVDHDYGRQLDTPHQRCVHPYTETPGLAVYHVEVGEWVDVGDSVADIVALTGEVRETVTADRPGMVLSQMEGMAVYEGDPLLELAVPDDAPRVVDVTQGADD